MLTFPRPATTKSVCARAGRSNQLLTFCQFNFRYSLRPFKIDKKSTHYLVWQLNSLKPLSLALSKCLLHICPMRCDVGSEKRVGILSEQFVPQPHFNFSQVQGLHFPH